jgi:hypothetical protein
MRWVAARAEDTMNENRHPLSPQQRRVSRRVMLGIAAGIAAGATPQARARAQQVTGAILRGANIRVRSGAGAAFPELAMLQGGQTVTLTGNIQLVQGHLWREVVIADGQRGWIRWEFFVGGSPAPQPGEVLVQTAAPVEPAVVVVDTIPAEPEPVRDRESERQARRDRRNQDQEPTVEEPLPDEGAAFTSGGLGLTLDEAEAIYGPSVEDALGRAWALEGGQLILGFDDGDRSSYVERIFARPVDFQEAQEEVSLLSPLDAESLGTDERRGSLFELYGSDALAGRFDDPEVWGNGNPGEFVATYGAYDPDGGVEEVDRITMTLGNRP